MMTFFIFIGLIILYILCGTLTFWGMIFLQKKGINFEITETTFDKDYFSSLYKWPWYLVMYYPYSLIYYYFNKK